MSAYGTSCARYEPGTSRHDAAWLRGIAYQAGCSLSPTSPGYDQCVTSALMRWTPEFQDQFDAAKAKDRWSWNLCPPLEAPSAERVASLRSARTNPAHFDKEKLIVAGVVVVSLLILAWR